MASRVEESVRAKMAELRLICDREIPIQQQRMDSASGFFRKSLESAKSKVEQNLQLQAKLAKVKAELREAENDLIKALAVKTRKEAKRMATMDLLSTTKARQEELKVLIEAQRAKKDEYASIISHQSNALTELEEKCDQDAEHRKEIEEAISWYNRVLGFRIECGHGVNFIFTNINVKNPDEEYSFTIRHANDIYTLLDCDPQLNDTKELINELNRSNGLFKFVRTMRERFQEAAACGIILNLCHFLKEVFESWSMFDTCIELFVEKINLMKSPYYFLHVYLLFYTLFRSRWFYNLACSMFLLKRGGND